MSESKILILSQQLCELLGANSSDKNVEKVSDVLQGLIGEFAVTNTKAYNEIVRERCCNDPELAEQIAGEIRDKRDVLIANLSALR